MAGIAGYAFGASGEMAVDMMVLEGVSGARSGLPHSMPARKTAPAGAAAIGLSERH
jgi:hypothetical protein